MDEMSKMDSYIWMKVFNFLKRLHNNKGMRWIKEKYFPLFYDGNHRRNWVLKDPKSDNTLELMTFYKPKRYIWLNKIIVLMIRIKKSILVS